MSAEYEFRVPLNFSSTANFILHLNGNMSTLSDPKSWTKGQRNAQKLAAKFSIFWKKNSCNKWVLMGNLFWTVIYLAGIALTILTCKNLYQQYSSEKYLTYNTAAVRNETITLPDPTICLPYFHADELIEHRWKLDLMSDAATDNLDENDYFYVNELDYFFKNYTTWKEIKEQPWPITILYVAQIYLSRIYETESQVGNNLMKHTYDHTDNMSRLITDILIPTMFNLKVSLGEFRDEFASQFKLFFRIEAVIVQYPSEELRKLNDELSEVSINESNLELAFLNQHQVCYKLKLNDLPFNKSSSVRIGIHHWYQTYAYHHFQNIPNEIGRRAGYEPITIDFSGKRRASAITHQADSTYFARFGNYTRFMVSPSFQLMSVAVAKGKNRCSQTETMDICQAKCRAKSIAKLCDCATTSFAWLLSDNASESLGTGVGCPFGDYDVCLQSLPVGETADCISQCLDMCARWKFKVETAIANAGEMVCRFSSSWMLNAIIEIKVVSYDYLIYEEVNSWTFTKIIGDVGGALAFWVGIDIFTILNYVSITLILFIKNRCSFKKAGTIKLSDELMNSNDENKNTENFQQKIFKYLDQFIEKHASLRDCTMSDRIDWMLKKLIWASLFLTGLILTITDYIPLIQDYMLDDTTYILNVKFNKTMRVPDVAICSPIDPFNYNRLPDVPPHLENDFNLSNMSRKSFLDEKESWSLSLVRLALAYLHTTRRIFQTNYDLINESSDFYHTKDILNALIEFRSSIVKWLVTDSELRQKILSEYQKLINIRSECSQLSDKKHIFSIITTLSLETTPRSLSPYSPTSVCWHIPLEQFTYRSDKDYCNISIAYLSQNPHYLTIKESDSLFYSDNFKLSTFQAMQLMFSFSIIYQSLETTTCFTETTPLDCIARCQNKLIEHCACTNCTAIRMDDVQNADGTEQKERDWSKYESCLKLAAAPGRNCVSECGRLPPCRRLEYTMKKMISGTNYNPLSTSVSIFVEGFTYPMMIEKPVWSLEQFMVESGGVFGFWIGLDIAFIVGVVFTPSIFFIGYCFAYIYREKEESDADIHILLVHFARVLRITYKGLSQSKIVIAIIERAFWMTIFAWFGIITATQSLHYYRQCYINIDSQLEIIESETFEIPGMTICVPYIPVSFDLADFYEADYQIISEANIKKEMILETKSQWSYYLLYTSWLYLTIVEGYKAMELTKWPSVWQKVMNDEGNKHEINVFSKKMENLSITHEELMQKFGQEMRRRYDIMLTKYKGKNGLLVEEAIDIERTTFVSATQICYALPKEALSFASRHEYIELMINRTPFYNSMCGLFWLQGGTISIDLLGRDTNIQLDDFILRQFFGGITSTSISIAQMIRAIPVLNGEKRCSTEKTPTACRSDCLKTAVEQRCNCTPKECRLWQLEKCVPYFNDTDALKCLHKCLYSPCERISYTLSTENDQHKVQKFEYCKAVYKIGVSHFDYPLYTETLGISFWEFTVALGGIVSIWLPLDVMLILETLLELAKRLFFSKKLPKRSVQKKVQIKKLNTKVEETGQLHVETLEPE